MLDTEEQEILDALETGQLKRSVNAEEETVLAQLAAKEHVSKDEKPYAEPQPC